MNEFEVQYCDKSLGVLSEKGYIFHYSTDQHIEIREVLQRFQVGYTERDIKKVDAFVEELFITGENTCVLGTGTGELFLGSERVKSKYGVCFPQHTFFISILLDI